MSPKLRLNRHRRQNHPNQQEREKEGLASDPARISLLIYSDTEIFSLMDGNDAKGIYLYWLKSLFDTCIELLNMKIAARDLVCSDGNYRASIDGDRPFFFPPCDPTIGVLNRVDYRKAV